MVDTKQNMLTVNIGDVSAARSKELNICFLGCEGKPPYGPTHHTAQLFLLLLESTIRQEYPQDSYRITMTIYRCQQMEYPPNYNDFHGVVLPGSFAAAYDDTEEWIERLQQEISTVLYPQSTPTLGVCFGHQIYAHALEGGKAVKCPHGPQAGSISFNCTEMGTTLLNDSHIELLYTHADMVESLPSCGTSLGGNVNVPIQAAVYHNKVGDVSKIVAVTFQAHPEYAGCSLVGYQDTFVKVVGRMRGDVNQEQVERDALDRFESVQKHSMNVMHMAGKVLGWFE